MGCWTYDSLSCVLYRFERGGHTKGGIQAQPILRGKVFSLSEVCGWLECLLAALDCYNWVLGEQLVAPSEVFMCELHVYALMILWYVQYYVTILNVMICLSHLCKKYSSIHNVYSMVQTHI